MDLPQGIIQAIKSVPVLTEQQERELIEKTKAGDPEARQHLILANLRWVWKVAQRYEGRGIAFDDLFQLGVSGLIKAIDKFDLDHKVRLTTYSTFWIRSCILDEIESHATAISVPKGQNIRRLQDRVAKETAERILGGLLSLDWRALTSKHSRSTNWAGAAMYEYAQADSLLIQEDLHKKLTKKETSALVQKVVRTLPRREKIVIWLRLRGWSLAHVARVLGVSQEGARKIEKRAHVQLRQLFENLGLGNLDV